MIGMDQYEMIRTAHRVYGKSIRQIARETGHHRKTIRKAISKMKHHCQRTKPVKSKVMDQVSWIIERWLIDDRKRSKKQRHTAKRIFDRLVEEYGFTGGESTVRRWYV